VSADFRVDRWLVKPSLNVISRDGTTARLEPKVMEVLVCLAGHAGEALSKEKLVQTVWPNTFVSDDALKRCISELRRAFEDDAREPHIIETISKRGYRFIAAVNRSAPGEHAAPPERITRDSVAVLPFINMSSDPENGFFADGITEEIINALSQIEQLHVAARTSSFFFKGKHIDMRQIGEQLNVRTVVEGSIRKSGDRLRITAQLVNVADGYHLWSERYDIEMKDIFAIQDQVARSIADRLKVTLERAGQQPLVKTGTTNLEAYQLYLKGRALLYQRGSAIPRALDCFKRAVTLDEKYALAWAGLADSHTTLGYYGLARPEASLPSGTEAAQRALDLDPTLAEAHNARAITYLVDTWDSMKAEQEFLCALELNPRYIQARDWYALFLLQLAAGRLEEGVSHARLAVNADPLSGYANTILGMTVCLSGAIDEGLQISKRAVELDPESFVARWVLHQALYFSQRFEEAVVVGETALAMSGRHPWAMATLASTLATWGRREDAQAVYAELVARAKRNYVQPSELAIAASAAGMRDEAIAHAHAAVSTRDPGRLKFSKYWPWSLRLREDPRFQELISEVYP
jgi:TolB-like protein/Flp pilus assembly protein TadD